MLSWYEIGENIKSLRNGEKISQEELAKEIGVSRSNLAKWETGDREIKADSVIRIADYFKVSCDEILRGVKSDSLDIHRKTGLLQDAINALFDINGWRSNVRNQYQGIINFIFGSQYFYDNVIKVVAKAITIQNGDSLGGAFKHVNVPDDSRVEFKKNVELLIMGNDMGYTDYVILTKNEAVENSLRNASDNFRKILERIVNEVE